jgi:hypothetical protein
MAKKTIVTQTVNAVRDVAEAAFDAAAAQARRVIVETVANTAARVEERAKQAMPAVEGAVKRRLVKPVDRMLGTRTRPAARKKKATAASRKKTSSKKTSRKKAAPKTTTHKTRSAKRAPAKKSSRKTAGRKKRL